MNDLSVFSKDFAVACVGSIIPVVFLLFFSSFVLDYFAPVSVWVLIRNRAAVVCCLAQYKQSIFVSRNPQNFVASAFGQTGVRGIYKEKDACESLR